MTGRKIPIDINHAEFTAASDVITPAFPSRYPLDKRYFHSDDIEEYYKGWVYLFSAESNWCRSDDSTYPVDCYVKFKDGICKLISIVCSEDPGDYIAPLPLRDHIDPYSYILNSKLDATITKVHMMISLYENLYTEDTKWYICKSTNGKYADGYYGWDGGIYSDEQIFHSGNLPYDEHDGIEYILVGEGARPQLYKVQSMLYQEGL